jgi:HlyD family secretion protein
MSLRVSTRGALLLASVALLSACAEKPLPAATETVASRALVLSVQGEGDLRSSKPTPLTVPGNNWSSRQVEWMLPEGTRVKKGDLLARFSSLDGKQQLDQAMIELQRNALARVAKQSELQAGQGRVEVDLSNVAVQLGIAQRYVDADLSAIARNEMLDAVEDVEFLQAKQGTLQWQRGQSGVRGGAELAVLDAQRATQQNNATRRQGDLDALELRAPNDGVVMLSANWSGDKAMLGATLRAGMEYGSLPDTSSMEVEIDLPQIESQGVHAGAVVELHPLGRPDQAITTQLSWVASAAKVKSPESPVKFLSMRAPVPPADVARYQLVPGQRFSARVFLLRAAKAISVANVAIEQRDGSHFVKVRNGDDFVSRPV